MKTSIVILLALGIGFAAAYFIVSNQKNAELQSLKQSPPVATAPTPTPTPVEKVVMVAAPAASTEESPEKILEDLLNVKPGLGAARNTALRLVVFKIETLHFRGTDAVPAIRSFLARNLDVVYETQPANNAPTNNVTVAGNNNPAVTNRGGFGGFGGFGGGFGGFAGGANFRPGAARRAHNLENLRTDWVVPPTLRLGLVGALKEIGGAPAEQALAEMLDSTGRGVEVAYLAILLEEIAPGKYRDAAIAAAKELLASLPSVENPDRFDQLSKAYLYGVLEFFKDTSFAPTAQQMLVTADGRLDQDALEYLSTVLKDQAVTALYTAYQNSAISNQFDKMMLSREILTYAGQNPQANALFKETLGNADLDPRMKAFAVVQLAGMAGPFASEAPTDPQVITGRIALLNSVQSQFADDQMLSQAIAMTTSALQEGRALQPQDMMRAFFGGGGGGAGGGFGGFGGFGGGQRGGGRQ